MGNPKRRGRVLIARSLQAGIMSGVVPLNKEWSWEEESLFWRIDHPSIW
jgi:hypothetical protein